MASMGRGGKAGRRGDAASAIAARAASILLCAAAGCWESVAPSELVNDADGDGGEEGTDSLSGVSCSDLSPCIQSVSSGFSCPGAAAGVQCWNLGSQCDALYLCANSSQACEIVCGSTACGESNGDPPQPLCD
jgi:hypothetical protein